MLKRRLLIRRIVSIAVLTLVVTGLAAVGLNAEVFAGFQRRATDALFPSAPDDGDIAVVGFDTATINAKGLGYPLPRAKVAAAHRRAERSRRPRHRVRRDLPDGSDRGGDRRRRRDARCHRSRGQRGAGPASPRSARLPTASTPSTDIERDRAGIKAATGYANGQVHLNKDPSDGDQPQHPARRGRAGERPVHARARRSLR